MQLKLMPLLLLLLQALNALFQNVSAGPMPLLACSVDVSSSRGC